MALNELILNADENNPMDKWMKQSDLDGQDLKCLADAVNDTLREAEASFERLPFRVDAYTDGPGSRFTFSESPVRAIGVRASGGIFMEGHGSQPPVRALEAPLHWRIAAITLLPALAQAHAERIRELLEGAKKALGT